VTSLNLNNQPVEPPVAPQLKPNPTITIPGQPAVVTQPKMPYEVKGSDGVWIPVEQAFEIEGGVLRFVKDGYGQTAIAGNWRGIFTEEYKTQAAVWQDHLERTAEKKMGQRVLWGVFILTCLAIIFAMSF
jgi:hypothetical protein